MVRGKQPKPLDWGINQGWGTAQGPVEWKQMGLNADGEGTKLVDDRRPAAEAWGANGIRDPSSPRRQQWVGN